MAGDVNTSITITALDKASEVMRGIGKASTDLTSQMSGLQTGIAGFAAATGLITFGEMIKSSIDAQDQLYLLSQKTGTSVEQLAGLKFAADQSGTSLESVANAGKKLSNNIAAQPGIFKEFGITAKDTTGALIQLADIFAKMPDGVQKSALAVKLMGKNGEEMIPFLNQGGEAIAKQVEHGKKYNATTAESAAMANQFNDNLSALKIQSEGLGFSIANKMLPSITQTTTEMVRLNDEGKTFLAFLRGFAGIGKLPWDLLSPPEDLKKSLSSSGMIEDAKKQLATIAQWRHEISGNEWSISQEKLDQATQKEAMLRASISTMEKHAAELDKPKDQIPKADGKGNALYDALGGGGTAVVDEYAKLIQKLEVNLAGATGKTDGLNAAQIELMKIMSTPVWEKASSIQKDHIVDLINQTSAQEMATKAKKEDAVATAAQAQILKSLTGNFDANQQAQLRNMDIMSAAARTRAAELDKVNKDQQTAREQATKDYTDNKLSADKYAETQIKITAEADRQREAVNKLADAQDKLNASWQYGAQKAIQTYMDAAHNTAAQSESLFGSAFKGMENSLDSFVRTGKANMSSFADSVVASLLRIGEQKLIAGIMGSLFTGSSGTTTMGSAAPIAAGTTGLYGPKSFDGPAGVSLTSPQTGAFSVAGSMPVLSARGVSASNAAPSVSIQITNNAGAVTATQQSTPQFNGREWVIGIVLDAVNSDPNFRNAMGAH